MIRNEKKILLVANTGWFLYNFRLPTAIYLKNCGLEPVFVSPRDEYVPFLQSQGFRWIEYKLNRGSINPVRESLAILLLAKIYKQEKPRAVHHFTPKCVFYGSIAAKMTDVPAIVNSITGLGHLLYDPNWKSRVLFSLEKKFYRVALNQKNVKVIFENPDDLETLIHLRLVRRKQSVVIKGAGVDTIRYRPVPPPLDGVSHHSTIILMVARLLVPKGVHEFVEAARILKNRGVDAIFQIAGSRDPGNPSSVSETLCQQWSNEKVVQLLGHVSPIESALAQAQIVVLPSYREGLSKTLIEAASMEKPIVTTDVPGCRDTVDHGKSGYLVPPRDAVALADAIEKLVRNPKLAEEMGKRGRKKAIEEFSAERVSRETLCVYQSLGVQPPAPETLVAEAVAS